MNANKGENPEIFKTTGIPYHFQSQSVLSLPRPNVTFFILTSTGLRYRFCNNGSPLCLPPLSSTTHKPLLVWKKCSLQLLFCFSLNTQASSYFLLFSILSLRDVSSYQNSSETVFQSATNDLLVNQWDSLFLRPHSAWPLEMSDSDDQFLLKTVLVLSSENSIFLIFFLLPYLFSPDPSSSFHLRNMVFSQVYIHKPDIISSLYRASRKILLC